MNEGGKATGLVVEEAAPKLKRPPLYQVVLINDDYTPMEFVVDILQRFFAMDRTEGHPGYAGGPYQGQRSVWSLYL